MGTMSAKKLRADFELAKRLPGHSQVERVRAARALLDGSRRFSKATEVRAFMSIFHPDYPEEKLMRLLSDVKDQT